MHTHHTHAGSVMGATKLLDFECEMGVFLGGAANTMGTPITMENAPSRIFGLVLLNDWSARDIQVCVCVCVCVCVHVCV